MLRGVYPEMGNKTPPAFTADCSAASSVDYCSVGTIPFCNIVKCKKKKRKNKYDNLTHLLVVQCRIEY